MNPTLRFITFVILVMPLFSCAGTRPSNLGVKDSRLAPCPSSPNCVSSDDADAAHLIPSFQLAVPAADAWRAVRSTVAGLPRTKIVTETDDYLHAECSSAFFGFVDDLELHLRPAQNLIAARSAARLGKSDFGVNRQRVENLRALLVKQGTIR
ncbi:MAG TPA: DUF1499 domain-containing protein [Candidatus Deferrimicrobium sp.]|nr:DUF1499 domain-containing protein [Candidatus Deferrimicrobium sp.]